MLEPIKFRRIAARLYGMKPENVTPEQAGFVSNVWSGSLAMLAALAGPVTAIVALALQSIASRNEKATQGGKLSRLARRLVLGWRWRRVRTVTVPVAIPVEKEVEKRVEVPVERVVKEILYVPILTDDPEAVRRALNQTLDKDIADLVTMSFARPKSWKLGTIPFFSEQAIALVIQRAVDPNPTHAEAEAAEKARACRSAPATRHRRAASALGASWNSVSGSISRTLEAARGTGERCNACHCPSALGKNESQSQWIPQKAVEAANCTTNTEHHKYYLPGLARSCYQLR